MEDDDGINYYQMTEEERICIRCGMEFPDHFPGEEDCRPTCTREHVGPLDSAEEFRMVVRTIVYEPFEPYLLFVARIVARWFI